MAELYSSQAELIEVGAEILTGDYGSKPSNDGTIYYWEDGLAEQDMLLCIKAQLFLAELSPEHLKEIQFSVSEQGDEAAINLQPNAQRAVESEAPDAFVEFVLGSFRAYLQQKHVSTN